MTKIVNSSEYSANSIFVGCSVNEDGEPLVEINGKAIGTVAGLLDFLGKYEGQQKATINVKWAAVTPPDGFLGPRDYKIASPHRAAAFLMDVPDGAEPRERLVMKAGEVVAVGDDDCRSWPVKTLGELSKHLANVEIKDACTGGLSVGSTNIEGGSDERITKLQSRIDEMESTFAKRVEEAIASAQRRNVRRP
ncbi:hypothetical protein [Rhizobium sp. P007]|uniref:hypothetical protein n=1 Tax=Rhizobium sp. P007 TaxID=285908 RepID=UPI00115BBC4D|nr:hypothetical protein [Rhizobium sp. P007]CAD7058268.1 phage tail protein [Rhizobium sp. P007]